MDLIIEKAFIQVLQDTLGVTPTRTDNKLLKGYLSKIDVVFESCLQTTITFVSAKEFLGAIGEGLFGESSEDDLELRDLSQELANLTAGLAKVLAIKENMHFNISTPVAFGLGEMQDAQNRCMNFSLNGALCSLFLYS